MDGRHTFFGFSGIFARHMDECQSIEKFGWVPLVPCTKNDEEEAVHDMNPHSLSEIEYN